MAVQTRTYKFIGLSPEELQQAIPTISFPEMSSVKYQQTITFDDDTQNGGSTIVEVDAQMLTWGWIPL